MLEVEPINPVHHPHADGAGYRALKRIHHHRVAFGRWLFIVSHLHSPLVLPHFRSVASMPDLAPTLASEWNDCTPNLDLGVKLSRPRRRFSDRALPLSG
jgi:hypothetical protein